MKRLVGFFLITLLAVSCAPKNNPSAPSSVSTATPLSITWPYIFVQMTDNGTKIANVQIVGADGPVTDAAVTFSYDGGSQGATFSGTLSGTVTVDGSVLLDVVQANYEPPYLNYTAGLPCTVTATFNGKAYAGSITTVGNITYTKQTNDLLIQWDGSVNNEQIIGIYDSANSPLVYGPPISSPVTIQDSSLPIGPPYFYDFTTTLSTTAHFQSINNDSYLSCIAGVEYLYDEYN
jgi:hypothetical protein